MSKTLVLSAALAAMLLTAGTVRAQETPERIFAEAELALKEGRLEEAIHLFTAVISEWPEDKGVAPRAFLSLGEALARTGRVEKALELLEKAVKRYDGWEEFAERAEVLADEIRTSAIRAREHIAGKEELERRLGEIERELKQKGLRGEELRRAYEDAKTKYVSSIEKARFGQSLDRLVDLWRQSNVAEEEIERRIARIERERVQAEDARRQLEAAARAKEQDENSADLAKLHRDLAERLRAGEEDRWRSEREGEMDAARAEFLRLAEHLGVPAEAAERLLDEHARRRDVAHRLQGRPREIEKRVEELDHRIRRIEEWMQKLDEKLTRIIEEIR